MNIERMVVGALDNASVAQMNVCDLLGVLGNHNHRNLRWLEFARLEIVGQDVDWCIVFAPTAVQLCKSDRLSIEQADLSITSEAAPTDRVRIKIRSTVGQTSHDVQRGQLLFAAAFVFKDFLPDRNAIAGVQNPLDTGGLVDD
jgi:hypothetical protein